MISKWPYVLLALLSFPFPAQGEEASPAQKRLEALSLLAVLARGYAMVTRNDNGRVVSRVAQASDEMKVRVSDGEFEVKKQ